MLQPAIQVQAGPVCDDVRTNTCTPSDPSSLQLSCSHAHARTRYRVKSEHILKISPRYEEIIGRDTNPGKAIEHSRASISSSLVLKVLTYSRRMLGHCEKIRSKGMEGTNGRERSQEE